jgi:ribosomal protein S18 acetylase RimI-like enzyme
MKMTPHFRLFRDDDLRDLEQMIFALYREDPPGQTMSRQKIRRTVQELSSHPDKGAITLIQIGDAVVGYAIVIYFWSNEYGGDVACIDELYVKPSWRDKGIGSSCLEHIARAKGTDLRGVRLEVTPANRKALVFYSRHGFARMANRHLFKKLRQGRRRTKGSGS